MDRSLLLMVFAALALGCPASEDPGDTPATGDADALGGEVAQTDADGDAPSPPTDVPADVDVIDTPDPADLPGDGGPDVGPDVVDGGDMEVTEPAPEPSPFAGLLVFNELLIHADTDTLRDPNRDGDLSAQDDEFIELLNVSTEAVDLGGFTLVEKDLPHTARHTFAAGTVLEPGTAIVVFGGGEAPEAVVGASFVVAINDDLALAWGLHLVDTGNMVHLLDAEGLEVAALAYGDQGGPAVPQKQSLTRAPDGTGAWVGHIEASPDDAIFSPGARVDGTPFE